MSEKHTRKKGETFEAWFWRNVDRPAEGGCWNWIPEPNENGYGQVSYEGTNTTAHRVAYILTHGPIRDRKIVVRHRCDNRRCCRPDHLLKGTHKQNSEDMVERGRSAKGLRHRSYTDPGSILHGSAHGCSVLTDAQMDSLRARYPSGATKVPYTKLAADYGVSRQTIWNAIKGMNWQHREDTPPDAYEESRPRHKMGEDHGQAQLTEDIVLVMRQAFRDGASFSALGKRHGVDHKTVGEAVRGTTWSYLPGAVPEEEKTASRGRAGEDNARAKLDDDMIRAMRAMGAEQIRAAGRMNVRAIAAHFERSYAIVYDAMTGKTWRHVV